MTTEPQARPSIGVPAPASVYPCVYDDRGPIVSFWQDGWAVDVRFRVAAEDARAAASLAAAFQTAADDLAAKVAAQVEQVSA